MQIKTIPFPWKITNMIYNIIMIKYEQSNFSATITIKNKSNQTQLFKLITH